MRTRPKSYTEMYKNNKGLFRILFGVVLLVLVGVQEYAEYKITSRISKNLPNNVQLVYEDINISLLFK